MQKPPINLEFFDCFGKLPRRSKPPTAIVIHHTATASPKRTRSALKSKGCSTHFEVSQDGTIYQYADVGRICSHCGAPNVHTVGIDVTHVTDTAFPEAQVQAVRELVAWLCESLGIPQEVHETLSGIWPHRALGNTVCPGNLDMSIFNPDHKE